MSATSKKIPAKIKSTKGEEKDAEVLYQKIGNTWYAFSVVDDEVFMGAVPSDDLVPNTEDGKQNN